jgi:hypothetical protein
VLRELAHAGIGSWRSGAAGGLLGLFVTLSAGCAGIPVTTDFDPSVDFAAFRSYAWLPDPPGVSSDSRLHDTSVDARVINAVDRELLLRGYEKVLANEANFHISYYLGLETRIDVQTVHRSFNYDHRSWHGGQRLETIVREYDVGTLLLDILDPAERRLVWRGSGNAKVRATADPAHRQARIDDGVRSILRRFPPPE